MLGESKFLSSLCPMELRADPDGRDGEPFAKGVPELAESTQEIAGAGRGGPRGVTGVGVEGLWGEVAEFHLGVQRGKAKRGLEGDSTVSEG